MIEVLEAWHDLVKPDSKTYLMENVYMILEENRIKIMNKIEMKQNGHCESGQNGMK